MIATKLMIIACLVNLFFANALDPDPKSQNFINKYGGEYHEKGTEATTFIQLSTTTVYIIGSIVSLLLILSISCLCYYKFCDSSEKRKYVKASQRELQNLKV